jgi:DNA-binding NtrC family response regulator
VISGVDTREETMARILVVDDQEMMRDSLAATLAREGHEIVATNDGPAAVNRLQNARFDLLITDLKMPKMTGMELLAEAKRLRPDMPVVLMTAFATVQTAVEAMKLGAYDYIQKPFDGEEIKLLVERTRTQPPQARKPGAAADGGAQLGQAAGRQQRCDERNSQQD